MQDASPVLSHAGVCAVGGWLAALFEEEPPSPPWLAWCLETPPGALSSLQYVPFASPGSDAAGPIALLRDPGPTAVRWRSLSFFFLQGVHPSGLGYFWGFGAEGALGISHSGQSGSWADPIRESPHLPLAAVRLQSSRTRLLPPFFLPIEGHSRRRTLSVGGNRGSLRRETKEGPLGFSSGDEVGENSQLSSVSFQGFSNSDTPTCLLFASLVRAKRHCVESFHTLLPLQEGARIAQSRFRGPCSPSAPNCIDKSR